MEFAEMLLNESYRGDMESLIQTASEYLTFPVMLVDSEYKGIAFYPKQILNDPIWDEIYKYNRIPPNIINQLNLDNMMQLGSVNMEPYLLNWGFLEKYPRILMNLFDSNQCIGYLAVLTEICTKDMLDKVKLIGIAVALKMHRSYQVLLTSPDYKTMFLNMLLSEKRITKSDLKAWISYFPECPSPPFVLIDVAQESGREKNLRELQRYLSEIFPGVLSVVRERTLILLCQNRHFGPIMNFLESKGGAGLSFGISENCKKFEDVRRHYEQSAFALSMRSEKKERRIFYKDVILDYIIMTINKYSSREKFIHPAVLKIQNYDEENHTQYLQTLQAYVGNLFNASDTVKSLHIHRNTLPHRIKMIEEIGGFDLKDPAVCAVLMLNFYAMEISGE